MTYCQKQMLFLCMNKFPVLLIALAGISIHSGAQTILNHEFEKAIRENPAWASLNACPYDFVYSELHETKAPKGYKPFYISHYGRHGSRSDWYPHHYSEIIFTLGKAKAMGILSESGDSLLNETRLVLEGHDDMGGRLTARGFREHRGIAARMFGRYKRVFRSGNGRVRVLSSDVPRCIMSMSAFTGKLAELCPGLEISPDCGEVLQKIVSNTQGESSRRRVRAIRDSVKAAWPVDCSSFMTRVFTDTAAARVLVPDPESFADKVFNAGRISRSFDYDFNIHRFLPLELVYRNSETNSIYMYLGHCNSLPFGEARMMNTQPLVRDVVDKADEAIAGEGPCADLRFGHDYPLLALSSFFGLEGVGERYDLEGARRHFDATAQTPFAGNLQLIFYKAAGKPVLVKFLLNETERRIIGLEPEEGPYYRWDDVKKHIFAHSPSRFMGPLTGRSYKSDRKEAYQGMDIWNGYIFSLQNGGAASIYRIEGDGISKVSQFLTGGADRLNHANVASFLPEYYAPSDPFPLVCISRCHKESFDGMKDQAYIERIAPDMQSSEIMATINYDDVNKDFGYALQWVVDREERMLYGFGNTINNKDPQNKRRVVKFRLPEIKGKEGTVINLRPEDALENYLVEETEHDPFRPVGQGLFVYGGRLYMPTGVDTAKEPSKLYVWNLSEKSMQILDLGKLCFGEPEDCSVYDGKLWVQTQEGIFRINLP